VSTLLLLRNDVPGYVGAAGYGLEKGGSFKYIHRTRDLRFNKKLFRRFVHAKLPISLICILRSQRLFLLIKALHSAQLAAQPEPLSYFQS
jgi:hypothetical protein